VRPEPDGLHDAADGALATSRAAASQARTTNRSEKQIEKMRPVSRATASISATWASVVAPGLSTMTSLPARIAWTAIAARSRGIAALTMMSIDGSSNSRSRSTATRSGKRSRKPSSTRWSLVSGQ
jgi:hypothetical protein